MVAPCLCKGSIKYVHVKCLTEWLAKKYTQMVITGTVHKFNHSCEICHSKYFESKYISWFRIFLYIFTVAFTLYYLEAVKEEIMGDFFILTHMSL